MNRRITVSQKKESSGYSAIIELLKGNALTPEQKTQLAGQIARVEMVRANIEVMAGRFKVVNARNAGKAAKAKEKNHGILDD
jgi:hypothetical protein